MLSTRARIHTTHTHSRSRAGAARGALAPSSDPLSTDRVTAHGPPARTARVTRSHRRRRRGRRRPRRPSRARRSIVKSEDDVQVKTLEGRLFKVEAAPEASIKAVKDIIETSQPELKAAMMKLIHSGKVLKDDADARGQKASRSSPF